jgi:hypothetical protein
VLVVASSCTVTTLTPPALIDVVTGISRFAVVDYVFMDKGRLILLVGGLGMNRGLSLSLVGRAPQAASRQARVASRQNSWPAA